MRQVLQDIALLQTCYFLNNTNTKHVRIGFFPVDEVYKLQVRIYHLGTTLCLDFETFNRILAHLPSVQECLRFGSTVHFHLTDEIHLSCSGKRVILRQSKKGQVNRTVTLDKEELYTFVELSSLLRHISQKYHLNSQSYLNYINATIESQFYIEPTAGLSPTSCERIYYELAYHGNYTTV